MSNNAPLIIPADFSSQLSALENELGQFKHLLEQESDLLKHNNITDLPEVALNKQDLSQKIETLVQSLNKTLQTNANDAALQHFFDLISSDFVNNIPQELKQHIEQIKELTQACHDLNLANGMSIQILNNINEVSLSLFAGQGSNKESTYSAKGEKSSSNSPRSSLGKA